MMMLALTSTPLTLHTLQQSHNISPVPVSADSQHLLGISVPAWPHESEVLSPPWHHEQSLAWQQPPWGPWWRQPRRGLPGPVFSGPALSPWLLFLHIVKIWQTTATVGQGIAKALQIIYTAIILYDKIMSLSSIHLPFWLPFGTNYL